MQNPWGIVIIIIGSLFFLGGFFRSNFIIYRLMAARSRRHWGEKAYIFNQISGILIIIFGLLILLGYIKTS